MQNRYVGDIGDYGKLGLLRHLTGGETNVVRLGVVWYLCPDESHNNDGRFTDYLTSETVKTRELRFCDPTLYDALKNLVINKQRNIRGIQESQVLPPDTIYYDKELSFYKGATRASKYATRSSWVRQAVDAVQQSDLVFFDPDNGISDTIDPLQRNGPKFVYLDDLRRYNENGQSLIVYHHLGRRDTGVNQIRYWANKLRMNLELNQTPLAMWYHRGTARVYFIIAQDAHEDLIDQRIASLLRSPWAAHFDLIR